MAINEYVIKWHKHDIDKGYGIEYFFTIVKAKNEKEARIKFFRKYPEGRAWSGIKEKKDIADEITQAIDKFIEGF